MLEMAENAAELTRSAITGERQNIHALSLSLLKNSPKNNLFSQLSMSWSLLGCSSAEIRYAKRMLQKLPLTQIAYGHLLDNLCHIKHEFDNYYQVQNESLRQLLTCEDPCRALVNYQKSLLAMVKLNQQAAAIVKQPVFGPVLTTTALDHIALQKIIVMTGYSTDAREAINNWFTKGRLRYIQRDQLSKAFACGIDYQGSNNLADDFSTYCWAKCGFVRQRFELVVEDFENNGFIAPFWGDEQLEDLGIISDASGVNEPPELMRQEMSPVQKSHQIQQSDCLVTNSALGPQKSDSKLEHSKQVPMQCSALHISQKEESTQQLIKSVYRQQSQNEAPENNLQKEHSTHVVQEIVKDKGVDKPAPIQPVNEAKKSDKNKPQRRKQRKAQESCQTVQVQEQQEKQESKNNITIENVKPDILRLQQDSNFKLLRKNMHFIKEHRPKLESCCVQTESQQNDVNRESTVQNSFHQLKLLEMNINFAHRRVEQLKQKQNLNKEIVIKFKQSETDCSVDLQQLVQRARRCAGVL